VFSLEHYQKAPPTLNQKMKRRLYAEVSQSRNEDTRKSCKSDRYESREMCLSAASGAGGYPRFSWAFCLGSLARVTGKQEVGRRKADFRELTRARAWRTLPRSPFSGQLSNRRPICSKFPGFRIRSRRWPRHRVDRQERPSPWSSSGPVGSFPPREDDIAVYAPIARGQPVQWQQGGNQNAADECP